MARNVLFILVLATSTLAQAPAALLDKAELVLGTGREREALELLDQIREQRHGCSAKLDYNIGVLAMRTGSRGLAVWNLRRAARHYPLDQRFIDRLQEARGEPGIISPLALELSVDLLRVILLLTLCLTLLFRNTAIRIFGLSGVFWSLGMVLFAEYSIGKLRLNETVFVVTKERAEVFAAPFSEARASEVQVVELAAEGAELAVEAEQGEFVLVKLKSGRTGWVNVKSGAIEAADG
jgi:hypothetical protein